MSLETFAIWAAIFSSYATVALLLVAIFFGWIAKRREALQGHETQWASYAERAEFRITAAMRTGTAISFILFVDLIAPVPPKGHPLAVSAVVKGTHAYSVTASLLTRHAMVDRTSGAVVVATDVSDAILRARAQFGLPALPDTNGIQEIQDTFAFVQDEHSIVWAHRIK